MAIVLAAELVRRQRDTNIDDAALRANALVNEHIPECLNVGIYCRVLLDHHAVDEAKLPLRGLIFILLCKEAEACIELLSILVTAGVHLDNVLKDEFGDGGIGHEGIGCDVLNISGDWRRMARVAVRGEGVSTGHLGRVKDWRKGKEGIAITFSAPSNFNFFLGSPCI